MFEQSNSENSRGTKSTKTRLGIYKTIAGSIDREKVREEEKARHLKHLEKHGNGKYTMDGSNDRYNGVPYRGLDEELYKTKDDRQSYHYGYTVHGARRLEALIWNLEKAEDYDAVVALGVRDYELGMPEDLLGNLVNCENYMIGYNSAKKGKGKRY